jgi:hypothetical protein
MVIIVFHGYPKSPSYPKSWVFGLSLKKPFPKIMRTLPVCEIIEYNIYIDHIHIVMIIPPRYSVSEVIGKIKA